MWIFGYGSLMYDGWEAGYACLRREQANLVGYVRSFTKASTVNWGSKNHPAPTLRVVPREGAVCHGVAFEFAADGVDEVFAYLQVREGKTFHRRSVTLTLADSDVVDGTCFFYAGRNVIADENVEHLAAMALVAVGKDGTGIDYIRKTKSKLDTMGIRDASVEALFAAATLRAST